jgi:hypothetical protein
MIRFAHDLVHGDDGHEYAKILFRVADDPKVHSETMWGQLIDGDRFRLANIPGWVGGLSRGDSVETLVEEGQRNFKKVVGRGGHSTYRIAFQDPHRPPESHQGWLQLLSLGCGIEALGPRMFAVDVPAATAIEAAYTVLRDGMVDGEWWFDEMHYGHELPKPDA